MIKVLVAFILADLRFSLIVNEFAVFEASIPKRGWWAYWYWEAFFSVVYFFAYEEEGAYYNN